MALVERQPKLFYSTDHYRNYPTVLIRLSKAKRADIEPLLRRQWRALASKAAVREFDINGAR
jgi:hypothetical protein